MLNTFSVEHPDDITHIRNNPTDIINTHLVVESRHRVYDTDMDNTQIKNTVDVLGKLIEYDSESDTYTVRYTGEVQIETGEYPNKTRIYGEEPSADAPPRMLTIPGDALRQKLRDGIRNIQQSDGWWLE